MEQIILMMMRYADMVCLVLAVLTFVITGITLHKLKKLEKELHCAGENLKQRKESTPEAVNITEENNSRREAETAAAEGEQEELLNAVLGEIFP